MKKILKVFVLACFLLFAAPKTWSQLSVGVGLSINVAPPALPVYEQPVCPGDGYIWTPGYWSYGPDGYYWVPGVWVLAPQVGFLWTPCYWGFEGGVYAFHSGYWGSHIGFYGGVNYGFGYGGHGYYGGRWAGGHFQYNTAVSHINVTNIHNTYIDRTVIVNNNSHTSFNGPGGVTDRPRPEEQQAMNEHHIQPTAAQTSHQQTASRDRSQLASVNHGRPTVAAMNKVGGTRYGATGTRAKAAARTNTVQHRAAAPATRTSIVQHRATPAAAHNSVAEHAAPRANTPERSTAAPRNTAAARRTATPQTRPPVSRPAESRPATTARSTPRPAPQHTQPRTAPARPAPQRRRG